MARPPKLTEVQKNRLKRLEPQLEKASLNKDLQSARIVIVDIQDILTKTGHITKLVQYKNCLFEIALDIGEYSFAEIGFIGNRKLVNKRTRLYLESTTLLAICYLRMNEIEKAKPLIKEVLTNEGIIQTDRTRHIFHKNIIERFDEEVALYSLKESYISEFDEQEIQDEANKLSQKNDSELFSYLGNNVPQRTKHLLFEVDNFSKKQLPYNERKALPAPEDLIKDEQAGKTVFTSLKRVIYNSLCDSKSEVYKAWYTNIVGGIALSKSYIVSAVVTTLANFNIGIKALIVSAVALVLRFGLDIYCEHYKPKGIMEIRKE